MARCKCPDCGTYFDGIYDNEGRCSACHAQAMKEVPCERCGQPRGWDYPVCAACHEIEKAQGETAAAKAAERLATLLQLCKKCPHLAERTKDPQLYWGDDGKPKPFCRTHGLHIDYLIRMLWDDDKRLPEGGSWAWLPRCGCICPRFPQGDD